jgi:LmbE family N-acetylglucosaminyl deacetylase
MEQVVAELEHIEPVDKVLVVMAHPDDVDFGVAGSVASWIKAGSEVSYLVVTDGDAGGFDPAIDRSEIPLIRRGEQEKAAEAVGVSSVEFLGYKDGALKNTLDLVRDISRVIRSFRPDRVVCQSPERNLQRVPSSHPDHRAAGDATLDAVYPYARNPFAFPELLEDGLEAYIVKEVLITAHPSPNAYVDVTDTFKDKIAAILCHHSQLPDPDSVEPMVKSWLSQGARYAGLGDDSLAEVFYKVTV